MKAIIFGAGRQAEGVAWYLANYTDFEKIGILSRSEAPIDDIIEFVGGERLEKYVVNVMETEKLKDIIKGYDVGINALPTRNTCYATAEAAIEVGLDLIDMLEDYHRRPDPYEMEDMQVPEDMTLEEYGESLHERAVENGVTFISGLGFAPGITNFTLGEALREMDEGKTAIARCGGIPDEEAVQRHPLKYMITWTFDHVLREYNIRSLAIKDGKKKELDALSEHVKFTFDKFDCELELECAVTPGMPSFVYTRPDLKNTYEKTIRWAGHFDTIKEFKKCGLLDTEPLEVDGSKIVPREFLSKVITPKLKPKEGDKDMCVMWNTAKGKRDGESIRIDYYMLDREDPEMGLKAIQRTTCFPPSIGAEMIAKGDISEKGIIAPEDCIKGSVYENMIQRLEEVGIKILKKEKKS